MYVNYCNSTRSGLFIPIAISLHMYHCFVTFRNCLWSGREMITRSNKDVLEKFLSNSHCLSSMAYALFPLVH